MDDDGCRPGQSRHGDRRHEGLICNSTNQRMKLARDASAGGAIALDARHAMWRHPVVHRHVDYSAHTRRGPFGSVEAANLDVPRLDRCASGPAHGIAFNPENRKERKP